MDLTKKIRVAVLFGGRSCEHEVSVISARSLVAAMSRDRYELTLIGISEEGRWVYSADAERMLSTCRVETHGKVGVTLDYSSSRGEITGIPTAEGVPKQVDVVFPLLHGPYGEDGTVQGLLELADVAYVGAGVGASAVGMDKELSRRIFRAQSLPQVPYTVVRRSRREREREEVSREVVEQLGFPLFVKPASLGSSVGVSRAEDMARLSAALDLAARFDRKIMVEAAATECREIEVAVLGNEEPVTSVPGEIVPGHSFYDYDAKYRDGSSSLVIPARIETSTARRVREMAVQAFAAIDASGLARVDFFVGRADERIYLNEINTMPGFTPVSMYPKLWEATGLSYSQLIDRLIDLALERHRDKERTRTSL